MQYQIYDLCLYPIKLKDKRGEHRAATACQLPACPAINTFCDCRNSVTSEGCLGAGFCFPGAQQSPLGCYGACRRAGDGALQQQDCAEAFSSFLFCCTTSCPAESFLQRYHCRSACWYHGLNVSYEHHRIQQFPNTAFRIQQKEAVQETSQMCFLPVKPLHPMAASALCIVLMHGAVLCSSPSPGCECSSTSPCHLLLVCFLCSSHGTEWSWGLLTSVGTPELVGKRMPPFWDGR